jgi:hypothetical protein
MADVPVNEKLYAMVVFQAKAKYRVYPSPGASHWVHRRYLELGGKFEDADDRAYRDKLKAKAIERMKRKAVGHGEEHDTKKPLPKNKKKSGDKK